MSICAVIHTPLVVKPGDPVAPFSAAVVPLGPRTYSKNKNGVRARHVLRASSQRFEIAFEADWGTWERVPCARFVYTTKWPKNQGVYPPLTISQLYTGSPLTAPLPLEGALFELKSRTRPKTEISRNHYCCSERVPVTTHDLDTCRGPICNASRWVIK